MLPGARAAPILRPTALHLRRRCRERGALLLPSRGSSSVQLWEWSGLSATPPCRFSPAAASGRKLVPSRRLLAACLSWRAPLLGTTSHRFLLIDIVVAPSSRRNLLPPPRVATPLRLSNNWEEREEHRATALPTPQPIWREGGTESRRPPRHRPPPPSASAAASPPASLSGSLRPDAATPPASSRSGREQGRSAALPTASALQR